MRLSISNPLILAYFCAATAGTFAMAQSDGAARSKNLPVAENILWQDPGNVESLDLAWGVGGEAKQPQAPFDFVGEELSGTTPKVNVKDAAGVTWVVKFGEEAKPSTFATRLAWACGYVVETEYLVPRGQITGVRGLKRAASSVQKDGSFTNGRFQLRTDHPKFLKDRSWAWNNNPFVGTPQLNGLKILVMLLSNWDTKDERDSHGGGESNSNLGIFQEQDSDQNAPRFLFFVSDWGGSLGKWGGATSRSKGHCNGYAEQTSHFVKGSNGSLVRWGFSGKHTADIVKDISVSDVQWLLQYLGRISDDQLRRGLAASGATPEQLECYLGSIRQRITQLQALQPQALVK